MNYTKRGLLGLCEAGFGSFAVRSNYVTLDRRFAIGGTWVTDLKPS
ncbi:MAG: hypothetical protein ABFD54_18010 [Armatimonadota bacterium]